MAEELRELQNNVEIVGLLKTKDLKEATTKTGKQAIMGNLVVEVKDGDKVNNIRVNVFAMKFKKNGEVSGLYKSDLTVMNEFKDIDTVGRDEADFISVSGQLSGNDYVNAQGVLNSSTQVRGTFFNRLTKGTATDHAWATVETVINSVSDVENEDGPTGDKKIEAYTVGYNGTPIELHNIIVGAAIAEEFVTMYYPGTTGLITYKINNYAEVAEAKPEEQAEKQGFGSSARVEGSVVGNFVNNLEIIGGEQPLDNGTEFTPEQITALIEARKQAIAVELAKGGTQMSAQTQGFGGNTAPAQPTTTAPWPTPGQQASTPSPFAASPANMSDDFDAF